MARFTADDDLRHAEFVTADLTNARRVAAMPAGTVGQQVDEEWSVAQTLRHLVLAVAGWVRHGIQGLDGAFSPMGLPFSEYDDEVGALGVEDFEAPARRLPPWEPETRSLPVWRCLGVIVNEAWEHHRFAERDLDELERRRAVR